MSYIYIYIYIYDISRLRVNQTLREPYEDSDTVSVVKKKRLDWIGHLVRMDRRRVVRK